MTRVLKASAPGTSAAYESLLQSDSPRTWSWCCRAGATERVRLTPPHLTVRPRAPVPACARARVRASSACSTCTQPSRPPQVIGFLSRARSVALPLTWHPGHQFKRAQDTERAEHPQVNLDVLRHDQRYQTASGTDGLVTGARSLGWSPGRPHGHRALRHRASHRAHVVRTVVLPPTAWFDRYNSIYTMPPIAGTTDLLAVHSLAWHKTSQTSI